VQANPKERPFFAGILRAENGAHRLPQKCRPRYLVKMFGKKKIVAKQ
jgi:hypothetical protein